MYKVFVLTDPDNADGFKLAGVEVFVARNDHEARTMLADLVHDEKAGIIAVNEAFLPLLDERIQEEIETVYRPIVVPLPMKKELAVGDERRNFLSRLISRAIGFDITLGRG